MNTRKTLLRRSLRLGGSRLAQSGRATGGEGVAVRGGAGSNSDSVYSERNCGQRVGRSGLENLVGRGLTVAGLGKKKSLLLRRHRGLRSWLVDAAPPPPLGSSPADKLLCRMFAKNRRARA